MVGKRWSATLIAAMSIMAGTANASFWPDGMTSEQAKKKYCTDKGGTFQANNGSPECIFSTKKLCLENGGEWVSVSRNGEQKFECYIEYEDSDSLDSDSGSEKWGKPTFTVDESTVVKDGDKMIIPVPAILECDADATVVVMVGYDITCVPYPDNPALCLPEPTMKNVKAGKGEAFPCGKRFDILKEGQFFARFRTVGSGKARSDEETYFARTKDAPSDTSLLLPAEGSGKVYLRGGLTFDIVELDQFDSYLFSSVLVEVLNRYLEVDLEDEQVRVVQVYSTGLKYEIQIPSDMVSLVSALMNDPLLSYPLAPELYENGLLNATDSCSSYELVAVDTSAFQALNPLTQLATSIVIAVAASSVCLVGICGGILYMKLRTVRKRELDVDNLKQDVDKRTEKLNEKEEDLSKREKELAAKLDEIRAQEKDLLEEKGRLTEEQELLEMEVLEAETKMEEVELEELREIDPEGAATLEIEAKAADADILEEGRSKLQELQEKYKDSIPPASLDKILKAFENGQLSFLFKEPKKPQSLTGLSDIEKLRAYQEKIIPPGEQSEYKVLLDQLIEKGALRNVNESDSERLKREYEEAVYKLESDLHQKKKTQKDKLAQRRRKRLDLIIQDAKTSPVDDSGKGIELQDVEEGQTRSLEEVEKSVAAELIQEIEEELNEQFEREKAKMKSQCPSQEEFESAMAKLDQAKAEQKQKQLEAIAKRREQVRKKVEQKDQRLEEEKAAAEAKRQELAQRVSNVFKKINSVENKVQKLKDEHEKAQAQLEEQKTRERERQKEKLKNRKSKRTNNKVAPS